MSNRRSPQFHDLDFKRRVIEEYLGSNCTKAEVQQRHQIRYRSAILCWMRKLGYQDKPQQKPSFRASNPIFLPKQSSHQPGESSSELQRRIQELEQRNKQLDRQLADEKLRVEMYQRIIEKAETELHIPIRKKYNTK